MTKTALYARYSTDMQSDASVEDQFRLCRMRAEKEGWRIFDSYSDRGISGADMMRPGLQALLQDAQDRKFDVLLAESIDRISRDQEHIAHIYKQLSFADIKIVTLSEGEINELHIGLKGTMGALFLKDLADKTRRGLRGRVEAGKSGGGLTYGYDVVKKFDANGEAIAGEQKINEQQAAVVRRIFDYYLKGHSPRWIAGKLNEEGILAPSGKAWGASTIYGNRQRGTGILNNELYIGQRVWNRLRYLKDPNTGKRVSRLNPEEEWVRKDVPEMRIIDQDTWDAVKAKQGKINKPDAPLYKKNRPRYLFSGLIKCGKCGGGYAMGSKTHLVCSTHRNKGTCDNKLTMKRIDLEKQVLGVLQTHLMDSNLCDVFCEEYTAHMNRLRMEHNAARAGYEAELEKLERERKKIVQSILDGVPGHMVKDDAIRVDNRRQEVERLLEQSEEAPVLLHPNMAQKYRQQVRGLADALNDEKQRTEASQILRGLIDKIVLQPVDNDSRLAVDLVGNLAGILSIATETEKSRIEREVSWLNDEKQVAMVAGVCNPHYLHIARLTLRPFNNQ